MYCIIVILLYLINPNLFVFDGVLGASWNFGLMLICGEIFTIPLFCISSLGVGCDMDEIFHHYFNFNSYKEDCNYYRPSLNLAGIIRQDTRIRDCVLNKSLLLNRYLASEGAEDMIKISQKILEEL